jgi:hypothetical protein
VPKSPFQKNILTFGAAKPRMHSAREGEDSENHTLT